jgi:hypothetical protein
LGFSHWGSIYTAAAGAAGAADEVVAAVVRAWVAAVAARLAAALVHRRQADQLRLAGHRRRLVQPEAPRDQRRELDLAAVWRHARPVAGHRGRRAEPHHGLAAAHHARRPV